MPGKTSVIDDVAQRLGDVTQLLRNAGNAIMDIYANEFEITIKADKSPVTVADTRSSDIIIDGLRQLFPDVPLLGEENQTTPYRKRCNWNYYWLLDPLDGTREFIKRNNEFCINLALMQRHQPVAGFIYQPVAQLLYHTIGQNEVIKTDARDRTEVFLTKAFQAPKEITVVSSRSHKHPSERKTIDAMQQAGYKLNFMSMGSAIKFCLMVEEKVHVYLRYGPTSEWDTAAGHALLNAIGGTVIQSETQKSLVYNKEHLLNPSFAALGPSVKQLTDYVL